MTECCHHMQPAYTPYSVLHQNGDERRRGCPTWHHVCCNNCARRRTQTHAIALIILWNKIICYGARQQRANLPCCTYQKRCDRRCSTRSMMKLAPQVKKKPYVAPTNPTSGFLPLRLGPYANRELLCKSVYRRQEWDRCSRPGLFYFMKQIKPPVRDEPTWR